MKLKDANLEPGDIFKPYDSEKVEIYADHRGVYYRKDIDSFAAMSSALLNLEGDVLKKKQEPVSAEEWFHMYPRNLAKDRSDQRLLRIEAFTEGGKNRDIVYADFMEDVQKAIEEMLLEGYEDSIAHNLRSSLEKIQKHLAV